jgi:PB1 domain
MNNINVKIDSLSKIKRVRDVPQSFDALKSVVEAQLKDTNVNQVSSNPRNYQIQYRDAQNDLINVSDDDDLLTAYEIATKELQGNLKL